MKTTILIAAAALTLAACSTSAKKNETAIKPDTTAGQSEFDRGVKALDAGYFKEAKDVFQHLLTTHPGTDLELVTVYDLGSAEEGLGDCKSASNHYRQVIRASAGNFKRIESQAMYRLSLMYECMGQDTKAIAAMLDARKMGARLMDSSTLHAEIPARLAAAYARLGNRDRAKFYFAQAGQGLKGLVAQKGAAAKELITRTLYLMGKLSPSQREASGDPKSYWQSISMQQPYLLQALEMHFKPWSTRAEDDLLTAYANTWKFSFKDEDSRREFLTRALQTLHELRNIKLPKPDSVEDALFAALDKTENEVQIRLADAVDSNPLTPEARKREGLRRKGRLVDPNTKKSRRADSGE